MCVQERVMIYRMDGQKNLALFFWISQSTPEKGQDKTFLANCMLLMVIALCFLSGCNLGGEVDAPAPLLERPSLDESTPIPSVIAPSQDETLIVWTPPFFSSSAESPAGIVLQEAYTSFQETYPDSMLEMHLKAESGATGLYQYIQTASTVAPAILPDIVLLDTQQMWKLIDDFELLLPLKLDEIDLMLDDAYPFTKDAVQFNEQFYGIPYVASVVHMAYTPSLQGNENNWQVPASWADLLNSDIEYIFPAAGPGGMSSEMLLLQYIGAGGQLTSDGTVSNAEALTALLNFMANGMERGAFPREILEISTYDSALALFMDRKADFVNVSAEQFIDMQDAVADVAFSSVPTRSGSALTIGRVWAFVILAADPEKHALALQFIEHLLEPRYQAKWSQEVGRLPTHMIAFEGWAENHPYYDFLRQQMDIALAIPNGQPFTTLSQQLQSAQVKVLNQELSIQDAVNQIINSQP